MGSEMCIRDRCKNWGQQCKCKEPDLRYVNSSKVMEQWLQHGVLPSDKSPGPGVAAVAVAPESLETCLDCGLDEPPPLLHEDAEDERFGANSCAATYGDSISSLRDKLSDIAADIFSEDMKGVGDDVILLCHERSRCSTLVGRGV